MASDKTEKQKVQEITEKLEQGLKELFESEKYKTYLNTMSKFHNYSFNNTMLITMQKPDATLVAGFSAWKKNFERHVMKGEKGIRILAPAPYKMKEEQEKIDPETQEIMLDKEGKPIMEEVEITIPAFRVVSVFDVSQTDGKELPEMEVNELSGSVEDYEKFMQALAVVSPVPIGYEEIEGDSKGYFHREEQRIAIKEGMSQSQTVKTAIHEVAHAKLHDRERNQDMDEVLRKDRNTKEVEAESIAYTVCQHFGIDTSDYFFGYIAGWSSGKDMKELKSSLDTIRKTASELITGIESELQKERDRERDTGKEVAEMAVTDEKELLFLHGAEDQYGIYQLKDTEETRDFHFMSMDFLERKGILVDRENYEFIYAAPLEKGMSLEDIYTKLNIDHPSDFTGHSLSVSDVVVLHQDGKNTSHYVDSFGYREVPEFTKERAALSEEQSRSETEPEYGDKQISYYVIEDLSTWAENAPERSKLERFDSLSEAMGKFSEYREKETEYPNDNARATFGMNVGGKEFDLIHVKNDENCLVIDFTRIEGIKENRNFLDDLQVLHNEIGFDKVRVHREMTPEKVRDFVKQRFEYQLRNSGLDDISMYMDRFASVYKGIHNKTTKYGLPTY